jgi:hypothetical protein
MGRSKSQTKQKESKLTEDFSFDLQSWIDNIEVKVVEVKENIAKIEVKGISYALANALRRIILVEVS